MAFTPEQQIVFDGIYNSIPGRHLYGCIQLYNDIATPYDQWLTAYINASTNPNDTTQTLRDAMDGMRLEFKDTQNNWINQYPLF